MLIKYLLVVIIFYFIVKTSGNLMRALRGELNGPTGDPRFQSRAEREPPRSASGGWNTRGSNGTSRPGAYRDDDIEDAEWEDIS
jgi:hypothetical protein